MLGIQSRFLGHELQMFALLPFSLVSTFLVELESAGSWTLTLAGPVRLSTLTSTAQEGLAGRIEVWEELDRYPGGLG